MVVHADRQSYRQADRQTCLHASGQAVIACRQSCMQARYSRKTGKQIGRRQSVIHVCRQSYTRTYFHIDTQTDNRQVGIQIGSHVWRQTYIHSGKQTYRRSCRQVSIQAGKQIDIL